MKDKVTEREREEEREDALLQRQDALNAVSAIIPILDQCEDKDSIELALAALAAFFGRRIEK